MRRTSNTFEMRRSVSTRTDRAPSLSIFGARRALIQHLLPVRGGLRSHDGSQHVADAAVDLDQLRERERRLLVAGHHAATCSSEGR